MKKNILITFLLIACTAFSGMAQYPLPATNVYGNLWVQDSTKAFNGLYQWDGSQWQPVKSLWDTVPTYVPLYSGHGFRFEKDSMELINDTTSFFGLTGVKVAGTVLNSDIGFYINGIVNDEFAGTQSIQYATLGDYTNFLLVTPQQALGSYSTIDTTVQTTYGPFGWKASMEVGGDNSATYMDIKPEQVVVGTKTANNDTISMLNMYISGSSADQLFDLQSQIPGQGAVGFESQIDFGHLRAKMYSTSFDGSTNLSVVEVDTIGILLNADDFGVVAKVNASGLVLPNLPADPPSGENGAIYFNTVSNTVRIYIGGLWTGL